MKILVIAPQPFYQERGTPIAIKLLTETLCEFDNEVDLLTYNEGEDVVFKNLKIIRIPSFPFLKNYKIGFSIKKILADILLFCTFTRLVVFNKYDVVHAVEESIFFTLLYKPFLKGKIIYDMDSSLADQLAEKYKLFKGMKLFLESLEKAAIKYSDIIVIVCKALLEKVEGYYPDKPAFLLEDIAFENDKTAITENIRYILKFDGLLALYVGNLESYQGIKLLIDGIAEVETDIEYKVAIIGGEESDINFYQKYLEQIGLTGKIKFLGKKPFNALGNYLDQTDILLSPRLKGNNTPMKIYSYLASGKPVMATSISSHTQILSDDNSFLFDVTPKAFSKTFKEILENDNKREVIGKAGQILAKEKYSIEAYKRKLKNIYNSIN
ncbi:MAG: glycosyltransferase family 4 protein [Melioribacteraceae bacterium]|nr:glycosyltransferase family 4 protein [Melioribacteraceae bacterium]